MVEQNLYSWILWASLDAVIVTSLIVQHGSFLLVSVYMVGSGITSFLIFKHCDKPKWSPFETLVTFLVVVCMIILWSPDKRIATVASTTAMIIAGIPQLIDAWKRPHDMPIGVSCIYMVANCLCTAGGSDWSIKERFFPASAAVYTLVIIVFSARRYIIRRPVTA